MPKHKSEDFKMSAVEYFLTEDVSQEQVCKIFKCTLAPNGKIYGISFNAINVLIIDPVTNTADTTTITGLPSGGNKYTGGVLAPNGKIYGIPNAATNVLQINTGLPTLSPWMLQAYFNKY